MLIEILDTEFQFVDYVYEYESFIWTDRYNTPGDFEIYAPAKKSNLNLFKRNYFVRINDSEHLMIIEDIEWESSAEKGNHVKVTGRSLESILDRRIVWGEYEIPATPTGDIQSEIFALLEKEIITGRGIEERKIPNFTYQSISNPLLDTYKPEGEYEGDSLLKIVEDIAEEFDVGWKIIRNSEGKLVFSFFVGTNRTKEYDLGDRGFVEFSPELGNISESNYTEKSSDTRTVMLVGGSWKEEAEVPGEEVEEESIYEAVGGGSGLLRKEIFHSTTADKDDETTEEEYREEMRSEGAKELKKYKVANTFDGKYETAVQFKYGKNFFIGDIVTVKDVFGHDSSARVTEFIRSVNISNGEEAYPTFKEIIPEEQEA